MLTQMEKSISFSFQGRYFTAGNKETAKHVWVVLHGYGQLASYFIRKFEILTDHNIFIIAPEALSRFYTQDVSERMRTKTARVGASWMTVENRLTDIDNYIRFLNEIYARELSQVNVPMTVLGFSQGAATATRWAIDGSISFQRLILWAGILPPDLDFSKGHQILKDKETYLVYGTKDPFLNDSRFGEMKMLAEKLAIDPRIVVFDGEHVIDDKTLLTLV